MEKFDELTDEKKIQSLELRLKVVENGYRRLSKYVQHHQNNQHTLISLERTKLKKLKQQRGNGRPSLITHLAHLPFENRVLRMFKDSEIEKVADLIDYTPDELLQLRNFGPTTLVNVQKVLMEHGYALRPSREKWTKKTKR